MLSSETLKRVEQWLSSGFDRASCREARQLLDRGEDAELEDRFGRDMEFGTGGLRGLMEAGTNRMNTYTVARATQGLANYIRAQKPDRPSVVIAYDSRHHSREFARMAAEVLAGNNIHVYFFRQLRPTPLLSFAVRHLGATAGVVITSSHNPKEWNGYKVAWDDGAQIVPPHDEGIIAEVEKIASAKQIRRADFDKALGKKRIEIIGSEIDRVYLSAISPLSLHGETTRRVASDFKIVYSPLHGTGGTMIPKALQLWGFRNVFVVPSQARADGAFPTVKYPNPEYPEAMAEGIALARKRNAHIVMASDPDADRLGVAVRVRAGRYQMLTGNQLGALLADYLCREMRSLGRMPANPLIVTTIVTTDLIERIAEHYGVALEKTLTGFKWIGERIRANDERRARGEPWREFIFGTEESYGYLVGAVTRDKDAVASACVAAEMAAVAHSRGKHLAAALDEIEMQHGAFCESQASFHHGGAQGAKVIERIIESLRSEPPREIGDVPVKAIGDAKRGYWRPLVKLSKELKIARDKGGSGQGAKKIGLPRSNLILFQLADDSKVMARPSGTEPKIKLYFNLCERQGAPFRSRAELEKARQMLARKLNRVETEFLRSVRNQAK